MQNLVANGGRRINLYKYSEDTDIKEGEEFVKSVQDVILDSRVTKTRAKMYFWTSTREKPPSFTALWKRLQK